MKQKITYNEWDKIQFEQILKPYLESIENDFLALHKVVKSYNWDHGNESLFHIIRNPKTDKATALSIYWLGQPNDYTEYKNRDEVDSYYQEGYDLLKEIEKNIEHNFYKSQQINYDPKDDMGTDWTQDYNASDAKTKIPETMFETTQGNMSHNEIDEGELEEGFPATVWEKCEELENKYEIIG